MKKQTLIIIMILAVGVTLSAMSYESVLQQNEKELLYKMLQRAGLDSNSVKFLKDWSSSTQFKLKAVTQIIDNPFKFPPLVDATRSQISTQNACDLLNQYSRILYSDLEHFYQSPHDPYLYDSYQKMCQNIIRPRHIFDYVNYIYKEANAYYQKAWKDVSDAEKAQLTYFAYSLWAEDIDQERYTEFYTKHAIVVDDSLSIKEDIFPIIKKINFSHLMKAACLSQTGFDALAHHLASFELSFFNKPLEKNTKWGKFIIGTVHRDVYDKNYAFVLDPGGDDTYQYVASANFKNPFAWQIDMEGNDYYSTDEIGQLNTAIGGISLVTDMTGDDVYRANDMAASAFYGYAYLRDVAGNDNYDGGLHSWGAATFGMAICTDFAGNDAYRSTMCSQGFGSTLGAGFLLDYTGYDTYFAGGKYLHAPLAPLDSRSISQGVGMGIRPLAGGGIGVLFDNQGNDRYMGGVYAQGVGYWYSLGMIIDEAGNDFYNAVYYPMGSGIHLAGGFLYDGAGDDHYYSKSGPGMGGAHDYGVAFAIDRAGNDSYSVYGANGLGLSNSVGVFLDVAGDDRYERKCAENTGYGRQARGSGSIGLFLDMGGNDAYHDSTDHNNTYWNSGTYGAGLDTTMVVTQDVVKKMSEHEVTEFDSTDTIDNIFAMAARWEVGSAKDQVKKARKILLSRESEAAPYIYDNKFSTESGLEYRALLAFTKESTLMQSYLSPALAHRDSLYNKQAISLIAALEKSSYLDTLATWAAAGKYRNSIIAAMGSFKSDKSADIVIGYADSPSEKVRVLCARSLASIDTPHSLNLLYQLENDRSFLIKSLINLKRINKQNN